MATADEDCGNACGYIEEFTVAGSGTTAHQPRHSKGEFTTAVSAGVVATRKYCVLRSGHGGGHSFRVQ